jgi:hypothetical protein
MTDTSFINHANHGAACRTNLITRKNYRQWIFSFFHLLVLVGV